MRISADIYREGSCELDFELELHEVERLTSLEGDDREKYIYALAKEQAFMDGDWDDDITVQFAGVHDD